MRRMAINQGKKNRYGTSALCALALTAMSVTPVLAQDAEEAAEEAAAAADEAAEAASDAADAAEEAAEAAKEAVEAPPPPLPSVPAAAPAANPTPAPTAPAAVSGQSAGDDAPAPEELIVTGSRVRRADLNTPAPITTLDRLKIEAAGRGSIGEILQQLPSQSNAINVQFNNGGNGATRVNLRGINVDRTLVLVNGRRFVAGGDGADSAVDLNSIPLSVVERIEVLKDGASAVYGSDAIGGVVNIITRRDFSGVETSLYTGAGQHGGLIYQISATAGEVTDKAGILFSFEYYNQSDMFADDREFSATDLAFDYETDEEITLGSSAPPQPHIIDRDEGGGNATWDALFADQGGDLYNDPVVGWRTYDGTGTSDSGQGDQYNYQPENYLLTPQERYNLFAVGHYNIFDKVRGYFEGSYTNRQSDQLLAPTPLFTITEGITVSGNNIYNPFGKDFIDVRRRMVEASNRSFLQDIDTYRAVLGVQGGLPEGLGVLSDWNWDGHVIYGRSEGTNVNRGRFVRSRVIDAIGPSFIDDAGVATCGTPGAAIAGCVPLDLFGSAGSITPEMLNYISYDGTARGFSEQQIFGADVNGPLFSIFDNPVGLAFGYQHRREEGAFLPDPITASGDTTGNKQEPTGGDYSVNAAYAELGIPLVVGVPGIESLELNVAARWVDFSSFGSELTWKFGGRWQFLEHIAARGTASRSFRAPSVSDLFAGQADSFPNVTDPCDTSGGPLTGVLATNCAGANVPANFTDERAQLRSQVGGNPDLDAETANTFTGGVVITPKFGKWSEGLSLTVDYWTISIDNSIQEIGEAVILSNCYSRADQQNCDLIQRDPNTSLITNIINLDTNVGGLDTSGIDIGFNYRLPTDIGNFALSWDATWLEKFDVTQADGSVLEGAGNYDLRDIGTNAGVYTKFRFNSTLRYSIENFGVGVNVNYVGPITECEDNDCQNDRDQDPTLSRDVDSWVSADLFASYRLSSPLGVTSLGAGINNVADAEPPVIYNGFLANSDAATYDYIGRYFYFRLSQTF